jgi:enediyne core biosynthesis thioesterase
MEQQGRIYEYRHLVTLAETNLLGNVYFSHYLEWQGRCRELFIKDKAPGVIDELARDLRLVTLRCGCEYFAELFAFDEVAIRMRLQGVAQNRIALGFEYWRLSRSGEELAARGEQQIASLRLHDGALVPAPLPDALREALRPYA